MITIDIPLEAESYEDKYNRLSITEYPKVFLELEKEDEENEKKYSHIKTLEGLIKTVLSLDTYFVTNEGSGNIIVNIDTPAYYMRENTLLLQTQRIDLGLIYTMALKQSAFNKIDFNLCNFSFKYSQHSILIKPEKEDLVKRIYYRKPFLKYINNVYTAEVLKELKSASVNVFKNTNDFKCNNFTQVFIKALGVKVTPYIEPWLLYKYSGAFIDSAQIETELKRITEIKKALNEKREGVENSVWQYVLNYIYSLAESTDPKVILKKKHIIFNKFLAKPCEHLIKTYKDSSELTLEGDYYVCTHGNKILCTHSVYKGDKIADFGESTLEGRVICKICGEIFKKNPEYKGLDGVFSQDIDDIKKQIFKKTITVVSNINFTDTVSAEFVAKFSGGIVNSIDGSIRNYFYDLDRQKGLTTELISVLKDVIITVHIYVALMLLMLKNPGIINYYDVQNDANSIKKRMVADLMRVLHTHLIKIKVFKPLNLDNIFTTVLERITGQAIKIPKEIGRFKIEDFFLYKYINAPLNDTVEGIFPKLFKQKFTIGAFNALDNEFKYDTAYVSWQNFLKSFDQDYYNGMLMKAILRIGYSQLISFPQITYDKSFIGYFYGSNPSFHKHIWSLALTQKQSVDPINVKQIDLDDQLQDIICAVCKDKKKVSNSIFTELDKLTILNSKINFYKNYCPEKFTHIFEKDICKFCKYGTPEFFNKYSLPSKYITLQSIGEYTYSDAVLEWSMVAKDYTPKLINTGKITKEMYSNFWKTFGQYEDVTFKNLLAGVEGNKTIAFYKIISFINTLNILLGQIKHLSTNPNRTLETFQAEFSGNTIDTFIKYNKSVIESIYKLYSVAGHYDTLKNIYIEIYNKLPFKFSEYWFKKMVEITKANALSEDDVKAKALITYKTKIIDESIEQSTEKNDFSLDGFDYDGKNHKE